MKKLILYIWQLPQNLLGLLLVGITGASKESSGYYLWKVHGSISLGSYVMLSELADSLTLKHEQGHQKQSLMLGWLYLPVIGLPSLIWAGLQTVGFFKSKSYYWFYTEAWADRLAGIYRKG